MKDYMPKVGNLGHHMMKRTCTNQVNLDYFSEEDMKEKYRLMLNLEGIATAIFANSPFDNKKLISIIKVLDLIFGIIQIKIEQVCYLLFSKKILILKNMLNMLLIFQCILLLEIINI